MKPSVIQEVPSYRGATEIRIHSPQVCDQLADFAKQLMKHLAVVAGEDDGEDKAGRQKFRLQTPGEVARRACDIAEHAFAQFEQRGWLLELPIPKPPRPLAPSEEI